MKATVTPGQTWTLSKPQVESAGGIVVAQNAEAARAGARVLTAGGTAMDAAVVTACVLSVVEPWLSGLGGGGFLLHGAADGAVDVLDFNLVAGQGADPAAYPLAGGEGGDWFNWPAVKDDRNLIGPGSICVPGAVPGLEAALARHGSLSWADALAPAIEIAERGMRVDWFADLAFAIDRPGLSADPAAAALFLDPASRRADPEDPGAALLPMPVKAAMLRRLAEHGARDFYEGQIARDLAQDLAAMGAPVSAADLAAYAPEWQGAHSAAYRDRVVHAVPGLSGGPSLLACLDRLGRADLAALDAAERAARHADAIRDTYEHRLTTMGHAASGGDCTSHVSVVDRQGNMVALTNTLLSRFGAKVVAPSLGLLLNNGMMWFDPRPGQPNSIAPGARPLANMCPVIATRNGRPEIALGAAGGRQIFPAVLQVLTNMIDLGLSPGAALHAPRIDASTPTVLVDRRAEGPVATAISARHAVQITEDAVYPVRFAVPSLAVAGQGAGPNIGAAHPPSPWAAAIPEGAA
ncbi:gamma-glutamyltransferase [Pseudoponticoccus marisrubri]|uniref:Gamma-glutamyltransferase n=1 Tax=Pseudoponticoccus marisrubri TaxID=1685382 RepID=A0A0W7WMJ2_9RHOB|nr:gamma-glutamyltransferase [Pseudoponticoccus marisrubri]KUF11805.1 gamma-glutamyltransferase [Pseudoponticoccus marisrubri]